jgi:hypothetical protein
VLCDSSFSFLRESRVLVLILLTKIGECLGSGIEPNSYHLKSLAVLVLTHFFQIQEPPGSVQNMAQFHTGITNFLKLNIV